MLQILRYNWPTYAFSAVLLIAIPALLQLVALPIALVVAAWIAWAAILWWTVASLAASHWIYERSPLMTWRWIPALLPEAPRRWVNLHSGLDQSTPALTLLFPGATGVAFDMYDPARMTEPSIERARETPPERAPIRVASAALPLRDAAVDCLFVLFAAHELREPAAREELFAELARALAPDGRLIVAEHGRDAANIAAFGPGAWHFLPPAEWRRLGALAGFTIERELRITPFVRVWSMRHNRAHV